MRATAIIKRDDKFLLVLEKNDVWLLPGGKVERNELPICAAAREVFEETGMLANSIEYLFEHTSYTTQHVVFQVNVPVQAHPVLCREVKDAKWVDKTTLSKMKTSPATRAIIEKV